MFVLGAKTRRRRAYVTATLQGGTLMKIAVIILGILGSLAFGGLGSKWVSDYESNKAQIKSITKLAASLGGKSADVDEAIKGVERTKTAGYIMIVVALFGLAASVL